MAVFKSVNAVEKCSVKFMEDDPKLIFEMHCKVEDCEPVQAVYDKSACPHELLSKPGVLISAVATFPATVDDISFGLSKEHVRLRSFIDESKRKPSSSAAGKDPNATRPLLTELTLDSADFDKYQLSSDKIEVVFSLRDLKVPQSNTLVLGWCFEAITDADVLFWDEGDNRFLRSRYAARAHLH
jgi:hypothetical protein